MSDSSLSDALPSDATIEQSLRKAIQKVYKSGKLEDLTVKRMRKAAEEDLDLQDDFFKNHSTWKERSKVVIQSEVDAHTEPNASTQEAPSSPPSKQQSRLPAPKAQGQHRKAQGTKRASTEKDGPKKRRKKDEDSERNDLASDTENKKPATKAKKRSPSFSMSPPPKEDEEEIPSVEIAKSESNGVKAEQSESEMSEVMDEGPKLKKRARKSGSPKPKAKKSETSKAKKASEEAADPDAEEIKRLQSWLVKCGIRKMWWKELSLYNTQKAKIRHLKDMLTEAGMTGRYSAEKASQIQEERELKADLEAVQQGNKQWGKTASEEEEASTGRPKRKLARGLEGLDFLHDSDGEETD